MRFVEKLDQVFSKGMSEIGQELSRLGVQGRAELGSALFTGQSYVPYGQGQNVAGVEHSMESYHTNENSEMQQENDGRAM